MNKSKLSVSIGLASLATLPVTAQEQRDKELPERPNVIVLLADDIGWGDLSPYGTSGVETPAVEELAQRGTRFTDAHCVAATSTLTLLPPHRSLRLEAGGHRRRQRRRTDDHTSGAVYGRRSLP